MFAYAAAADLQSGLIMPFEWMRRGVMDTQKPGR